MGNQEAPVTKRPRFFEAVRVGPSGRRTESRGKGMSLDDASAILLLQRPDLTSIPVAARERPHHTWSQP